MVENEILGLVTNVFPDDLSSLSNFIMVGLSCREDVHLKANGAASWMEMSHRVAYAWSLFRFSLHVYVEGEKTGATFFDKWR